MNTNEQIRESFGYSIFTVCGGFGVLLAWDMNINSLFFFGVALIGMLFIPRKCRPFFGG